MNSAFEGFSPGRLWSLWDMLKFNAHAFVRTLEVITSACDTTALSPSGSFANGKLGSIVVNQLEDLKFELQSINLPLSIKTIEEILQQKDSWLVAGEDRVKAQWVSQRVTELRKRLYDELETKHVFCVGSNAEFLSPSFVDYFSQKSRDKFPKAVTDMAEASKCLALNRNTACVFHLMRVLELAIQKLGKRLGISLVDKNGKAVVWGVMLQQIKSKIDVMVPGNKRDHWHANASLLYHVKEAWRNKTMHPKNSYTDEEAQVIYNATRSFMNDLASLV